MTLQAQLELDQQFNWSVPQVNLDIRDSHHFNQQILNSILGIYGFGNTEMSGGFVVDVNSANGKFDQWQIRFEDFYALNKKRKLQVDGLSGAVNWLLNDASNDSYLTWQSLLFAGMPVNQSEVNFNLSKDRFELLGRHEFPVFDGAIVIRELMADNLFSESIGMSLNAAVLPMSLK
ncbi:MAG: hypothetical protein KDI92_16355, partial [Xanthomonadales bacterium]|nr:hypothetical protein [Xanthomonadales bacterium]